MSNKPVSIPSAAEWLNTCGAAASRDWKEGWNDLRQHVLDGVFAVQCPEAQRELLQAAQAVVDRWDSPNWKDGTHTGDYINRLRKAIRAADVATPKDGVLGTGHQTKAVSVPSVLPPMSEE